MNQRQTPEERRAYAKRYRGTVEGWSKALHRKTRERAEQRGIPYELDITWLEENLVSVCPALGIPIILGADRDMIDYSPSLDRVDNSRGYTRDNSRIISFRANRLKGESSLEELAAIVGYIQSHTSEYE